MHYPNRTTFQPAREATLHWLQGTPLGAIDEQDVVLSHGGQNGVSLALQSILSGPTPVVLVEELSYAGFRRAAALLRAEVIAMPMDARGVIPEAIAAIAKSHDVQAICTSPEVHNPTGLFTPVERREEIVEVARTMIFRSSRMIATAWALHVRRAIVCSRQSEAGMSPQSRKP